MLSSARPAPPVQNVSKAVTEQQHAAHVPPCGTDTWGMNSNSLSVQLIGAAPRRGDGAAIDALITYFAKYFEFL